MYAGIYKDKHEAWGDYMSNAIRDEWYGQFQIIEGFRQFLYRRKWEREHPEPEQPMDARDIIPDPEVPF